MSNPGDPKFGPVSVGHNLPMPQTARAAALDALLHVEQGSSFLRDELNSLFDRMTIDPRDRGLALQLAAGAIRHRRTLRLLLSHLRGDAGRAGTIQAPLMAILELGAFQLLFLDRVPAYAAINEAVEAARRFSSGPRGQKTAGFINGMLRGLQRLIVGREPDAQVTRDTLPHPEGGILRLREAVLPDPAESVAAFLGAAYSYPDWLVARWLTEHGSRTEEICRWGNRRPRLFARLNPMRPGARAALEAALAAGQTGSQDVSEVSGAQPGTVISSERSESRNLAVNVGVPSGPRPGSFDVSELSSDRLEALLAEGMLAVQDPSAMAAVEALAPQPGENVLDLCASPGTKTMQIVERMGDCGRVVACDRTAEKLESIRRTVAARGLKSVTVCVSDIAARPPVEGASPVASSKPATTGGLPASADGGLLFDAALVDAPCSNTGVLARRPEARWRLRSEDLEELPRVQLILLTQAALRVRPGGRLVYSTCSLQREENDGVVRAFLKQNPAWRVVRSEQILPSADHDGAFWALLAR